MRLVTKITLLYVLLMFMVFSIGGIVTYNMVKDVVRQETDYALRSETRLVVQSIGEGKPINALENAKISITEIGMSTEEDNQGTYTDTLMMHRFSRHSNHSVSYYLLTRLATNITELLSRMFL